MFYSNINSSAFVDDIRITKDVHISALNQGVSYSTACKWLRDLNIDHRGGMRKPIKNNPKFSSWLRWIAKLHPTLKQVSAILDVTQERASAIYSSAEIDIRWDLENNDDVYTGGGRRAELWVKMFLAPFVLKAKVLQDAYLAPKGGKNHKFDLVLERYGSIDVKHTVLKTDYSGRIYSKFSVRNFSKGVKFAFLVTMDETRTHAIRAYTIPGYLVHRKSSIHISHNPDSPKYAQFLVWELKCNSK